MEGIWPDINTCQLPFGIPHLVAFFFKRLVLVSWQEQGPLVSRTLFTTCHCYRLKSFLIPENAMTEHHGSVQAQPQGENLNVWLPQHVLEFDKIYGEKLNKRGKKINLLVEQQCAMKCIVDLCLYWGRRNFYLCHRLSWSWMQLDFWLTHVS